ncbi:hypothetical protein [Chitinophaga arvensicola]|uniref:Uncharacterized protein n=1 Tax=Chitinophaga arvensicola TaxID=29529 RepID=A0A1I0S8G7_9BACT|nr:hypothetical protein [Chitinophaga arvensicola]SEW52356.1 hypothetical protein SAMN04488122_4781 [Chitinophaga arvensicola]
MFNLFKRSKVEDWEKQMLLNIFSDLSSDLSYLKSQIKDGILKSVSFNTKVIPNYVGFRYNPEVIGKYRDENKKSYILKGAKVYDKLSRSYLDVDIYVLAGTVAGYATLVSSNVNLDVSNYKVSDLSCIPFGANDYDRISHLLSKEARKKINPDNVYEVELDGEKYFHVKELPDGDFIGIDLNGKVYKFSHDPYEICEINKALEFVL